MFSSIFLLILTFSILRQGEASQSQCNQISRQYFENAYDQGQAVFLYHSKENRKLLRRIHNIAQDVRGKMGVVRNVLQLLPHKAALEQARRSLGMGKGNLAITCSSREAPENCAKVLTSSNVTGSLLHHFLPCGPQWHHLHTAREVMATFLLTGENEILIPFIYTNWTEHKWKWFMGQAFFTTDSGYMCDTSPNLQPDEDSCIVAKRRNDAFCLKSVPCKGSFRYACLHDSLSLKPTWS